MPLLVFDTSTLKGGVAVFRDDQLLSRLVWNRDVSHGELLTPALQRMVEDAGLKMRDLTRIAIGNGPGSFTGVRIAVNAARALGYALGLELGVYDTSEILAAGVTAHEKPVLTLINAHKNLVFASTFGWSNGKWLRKTPLSAMSLENVEKIVTQPHLCVGDGFEEFESQMSETLRSRLERDATVSDFPLPEILGRLDQNERATRQSLVWKDVQALYIRASGAEEKLEENRDHKP
jgi:tRNA threonylcarbamoyladenosine biosynthesis protein TsaB